MTSVRASACDLLCTFVLISFRFTIDVCVVVVPARRGTEKSRVIDDVSARARAIPYDLSCRRSYRYDVEV
jgi:hypothetical protein